MRRLLAVLLPLLLPTWAWLTQPSGAAVPAQAGWLERTWRTVYDAPIGAHPIGAWAVLAYAALIGAPADVAWAIVPLAETINQWHKVQDRDYGRELLPNVQNVAWREALSAISTWVPLWALGLFA